MPTAAEDRKIIAAAKLDPGAKPLTNAQLAKMVTLRSVTGSRGRPKQKNTKKCFYQCATARKWLSISSRRATDGNRKWIACSPNMWRLTQ